jgi:hypothetical protein
MDSPSTLTVTAQSLVVTDRPARYAEQIAKHFGHKCETQWSGDSGFVAFEAGRCEMHAENGGLRLAVAAPSADRLAQIQDVVKRHLERWGEKDALRVAWTPTGGSAE